MTDSIIKPKHSRFQDLTGLRFGRLIVISYAGRKNGRHAWFCECDCKNEVAVAAHSLKSGNTSSCDCYRLERLRDKLKKHGMKRSSEYNIWCGMKSRCLNPVEPAYANYGGRGINVCDEWRDSFTTFFKDMGPRPNTRYTLERRDNNKGYSKNNCYWATRREQMNNRRNTVWVKVGSIRLTLIDFCEKYELKYDTTHQRLESGWSTTRIIMNNVEATIQIAVIRWIEENYPHVKVAASQNENSRHATHLGTDLGEPDLRLLDRRGNITHLLYLELKTKKGKLKPSQIAWAEDFDANYASDNCKRDVAYGFAEARRIITAFMSPVAMVHCG